MTVKKVDNTPGVVTVVTAGSETIDGSLFGGSYFLESFQQYVTLQSDGSGWNVVANN